MDNAHPPDQTTGMAERTDSVLREGPRATWRSAPNAAGLAGTLAIVGAAVLLGHWGRHLLPQAGQSPIFLVAVLLSAVGFGFWAGLLAAILAFLGYNFFFVDPIHTLSVARPEDILTLSVFVPVALLTGFLAGRMREESAAARHRASVLEALAAYSTDLGTATSSAAIEAVMARHLFRIAGGAIVLLRDDADRLIRVLAEPADTATTAADLQSADRALRYSAPQPATAFGWEGSRFSFHPLTIDGATHDVFGIEHPASGHGTRRHVSRETEQAIESILRQGAGAIERLALTRAAADARDKAEREALRSAVLSSLSHDLRTPLATILGSVTSLRLLGETLPPEARADLLQAIEEETGRLSRYVSNLLHMTRLQSGLDIRLDWIDTADTARAAIKRMRAGYPNRDIRFDAAIDAPVPLIHADAELLEQALCNLIDNAIKFSPSDEPVAVTVTSTHDCVSIGVTDRGVGIPDAERERIFEPFFRGTATPPTGALPGGAGLGLAICRGIVQALGGTIRAAQPEIGAIGTTILLTFPIGERNPR